MVAPSWCGYPVRTTAPDRPARAHIVYGTPTVHLLVAGADVVARARIVDAHGALVLESPVLRRPVVEAELLEVLKGDIEPGTVRFAQHGHGVAEYEKGEEVLLFLLRIERSRELARLGPAGRIRYVSLQEHEVKFLLTPGSRDSLLAAVRAYVEVETLSDPAEQSEALRRVTVAQLVSGDPRLAASAVRDLVLAEDVPLVTQVELPMLEPLLPDPDVPIGVRIGLLAELERRGLVVGPPHWVHLLETAKGPDRRIAVRAAGRHPSPPVTAILLAILSGDDAAAAAESAVALGTPGNDAAVAPLVRALARGDERLRMAAIRGLGRIATPGAQRALEAAASSHPDPATRRRARAEVTLLARRGS